jgi:hypothetical protein
MTEGPANRRWLWTLLATVTAFLFIAALVLPALFQASNCGGNSAAITACDHYLVLLELWEHDNPGQTFRYDSASPYLRRELADLAGANWVMPARFLGKLNDVRIDPSGPKQIVVVCDRAYDNVPRGVLWKSPMAHAVGYSTGATGLISPSEFAQLDLDGFVELVQEIQDSK